MLLPFLHKKSVEKRFLIDPDGLSARQLVLQPLLLKSGGLDSLQGRIA